MQCASKRRFCFAVRVHRSIASWVATELAWAVSEEDIRSEHVLIPLDLDGYLATWNGPLASTLKNLLAADCRNWNDESVFQWIIQENNLYARKDGKMIKRRQNRRQD